MESNKKKMNSKNKIFLSIICFFILSSCSHQIRMRGLVKSDKIQAKIANNDASRRNAYFIYDAEKNKAVTLSEPPPDAIVSQITSLTNKLKTKTELNTEQSVNLTEGIIQLGQRTVAVNILRDALFRLNEMNVNNQNQPMDSVSKRLFAQILSVSENISKADAKRAETQNIQAEANLVEKKTENTIANGNLLKLSNANYLEDEAFNNLKNKDFEKALKSFENLENSYPSYHNAFEIYQLLVKYKNKKISEEDWKVIFEKIYTDYQWGMPDKFKLKINK